MTVYNSEGCNESLVNGGTAGVGELTFRFSVNTGGVGDVHRFDES